MRVFHHLFSSILLIGWLGFRLIRRRGLPQTPLNPLLYIGVLIWFASALLSLDPRMALENLWFPLTNLLLFFVMVDLIQSGRENLLTETMFLLAALVVMLAGLQLASWYFGWGFASSTIGWREVLSPEMPLPPVSPRLYVPLGVSTWLAAYTAPLVVLAAAWAWSARRRATRRGFVVLAGLLMAIMLLTNSRGGWISLGAGGGLFALLMILQDARLQRIVRRLAIPLALLVVAGVAAGAFVFIRISSDPGHSSGDVLRFDLWRGAITVASDQPLLGVGPGLFGKAYRLIRDPVNVDNRLGTAHSFYLNALAETGLIGGLLMLALGIILLRSWWRLWRTAETPARKTHLAGALAALAGLGVQSLFDTFTSAPLVLLALSLTAYCVTAARSRIEPPLTGSRPAAFASLAIVTAFAVGLLRSDQAQAAFNASLGGSLEQAEQAAALDPALNLYQLQVAYLIGNGTDAEAGIVAYQRALALEPTWDTGWINLAALYQRQGTTAQALDALQHAIAIDNRNGAPLLWGRLAEEADAAPDEEIFDAYDRFIRYGEAGRLAFSPFWTETDLRRQVLDAYSVDLTPDLRYRLLAVHDPAALEALVPAEPASAAEWWVVGEHALTVEGDADAAFAAFSAALNAPDVPYPGDYYASRARARFSADDLALADLLGIYNESTNAIRAAQTEVPEQKANLLAAAVPPQVIQQNFEGVLFAGRVASFTTLPEMRLPGVGRPVVQPWYDLADLLLENGQTEQAINVYRAILDNAPYETQAEEQLALLTERDS